MKAIWIGAAMLLGCVARTQESWTDSEEELTPASHDEALSYATNGGTSAPVQTKVWADLTLEKSKHIEGSSAQPYGATKQFELTPLDASACDDRTGGCAGLSGAKHDELTRQVTLSGGHFGGSDTGTIRP